MEETIALYYFQKFRKEAMHMIFLFMLGMVVFPLTMGIIIFYYERIQITSYLLLILGLWIIWQIDVSLLYASELLSGETIDFLFRFFRLGPIFLPFALFNLAVFMSNEKDKNIKLSHKPKWYQFTFNRYTLAGVFLWNLLVYIVNFTEKGISGYEIIPRMYDIQSYYPIYGEWDELFYLNVLIVLPILLLFTNVAFKIENKPIRTSIFSIITIMAIFTIIGSVSLVHEYPIIQSFLIAMILPLGIFTIYFRMHKNIITQMSNDLKEQRNFLKKIINLNPNYIFTKDKKGKFLLVNKATADLYNMDITQMHGKNELDISYDKDEARDHIKHELQVIKGKKENVISEDTYTDHYGNKRFVQVTRIPLFKNGVCKEVLTIATDITQRKKNEELYLKSEKLNVVGELAAGIAHEIRNPLTSIKGFLTLLGDIDDKNKRKHYIQIMDDELDRINLVAGELLLLSKPHDFEFKQHNLIQIIEEVKILIQTSAIMKSVDIILHKDTNEINMICIKNQLKQVFLNILKNSIEAMPNGGKIIINIKQQEDQAFIQIIDEGVGISQERLKKLGEPFYTTKEKGTGLGLMVCYRIIEKHNGSINYESKLDEGTTVNITLPLNIDHHSTSD